jgi:hypothetical protein
MTARALAPFVGKENEMDENAVRAILTASQKQKLDQLEDELRVTRGTLPIRGQSEGYVFTEVDGITALITLKSSNPRGGYTWCPPSALTRKRSHAPTDAAVGAKEPFEKQIPDPDHKYGHINPIVGLDWKCGNRACPCSSIPPKQFRQQSRKG